MRYRVNPDFVMLSVDGENLLARVDSRFTVLPRALPMNSTAAVYWKMLEEELDTHEMLQRMRDLCKDASVITEESLEHFLSSLEAAGAITKNDDK